MNLGNFMHSPVGFGVYGNLLDTLKSGASGLVKGAVGQLAGQVEVITPTALAGAKLTGGFKIIKEGDGYKIVLDSDIPALSSFTGLVITGKDPVKEKLAGAFDLEYTPPPSNYVPFIIGGALAIAAVVFYMSRRDATPAAARRRIRKSKKRRRR
jgi:hypothetical protein